jgi:hypothetical protein
MKLVFLFLITTMSVGFTKPSLMEVEWKKIELEKVLSERIRNLLLNESVDGVSGIDVRILLDKESLGKIYVEKKSGVNFSGASNFTPIVKFDLENEVVETSKDVPQPEIDIYKFITKIDAAVYLDSKVPAKKKDVVLSFLKKNFSNYSGVQITYDFKEAISAPERPVYLDPRNQEFALYFLISILVISAIILASRILFKGFQSVASSFDRINEGMQAVKITEEEGKEGALIEATKISFKKYEGVKKFKELLDLNLEEAASILKGWLNIDGTIEKTAIFMLTRHLGIDDLQKLYKFMGHRYRYRLGKFKFVPKDSDYVHADAFLQEQLSSFVLLGERLEDTRLKCLVLESSDQVVKKIIETNCQSGAYLLSFLSPIRSSRILRDLKDDLYMKIMSTVIEQEISETMVKDLSITLSKFNEPFNQRLPLIFENIEEHLLMASPQREEAIFKMALDHLDKDQLIEIGLKSFPVFLCHKFSLASTFSVLNKMAPSDKLSFLLIQEEAYRNSLIDLIGKPGSKAREVIEVDLQRMLQTQEVQAGVNSKSDKIWYTFAQSTRKILASNSKMNKEAHEILSAWIEAHLHANDSSGGSLAA